MASEIDTLYITKGENPDVIFEFYSGELETDPRLDLTGATITITSNIPSIPLVYTGDATQGVVSVAIPLNVGAALKTYTDYWITVSAVDATSRRHVAQVFVNVR